MANSNIPRLNSLKGKSFLSDLKNSSGNVYSAKQVDSIVEWANGIMRRFGSYVFVRSVEIIIESLTEYRLETIRIQSIQESQLCMESAKLNDAMAI